jgi:hypothetical protein
VIARARSTQIVDVESLRGATVSLKLDKYFGLFAVAGLAGFVTLTLVAGGCKGADDDDGVEDGNGAEGGAGTEAGLTKDASSSKGSDSATAPPPKSDAGTKKDSGLKPPPSLPDPNDPDAGNGPVACLNPAPIDATQFLYKSARVSPGSCTSAELSALVSFVAAKVQSGEDVLPSQWSKAVSAPCASCVFSGGSGTTWTPVVVVNDTIDVINGGGCIEVKSGSASCGRAYHQWSTCLETACSDCLTYDDYGACESAAQIAGAPCASATEAVLAACGANANAYLSACNKTGAWTFEGPITAQCISGN